MWIARDCRWLLFIYDKKPIKQDGFWVSDGRFMIYSFPKSNGLIKSRENLF